MDKKIIVIPDSFKGSMSSKTVADIISGAIENYTRFEPVRLPIADGGEGSTECVIRSLGGKINKARVHSPEAQPIEAAYGITSDGTAVIEIAESSGLTKQSKLNPLTATTFGFGELIKAGLDNGARKFLLCLGGSATTDCGCGMAAALGVRFYDDKGRLFVPNGETLKKIAWLDTSTIDPRVKKSIFTVMSDVANPLYGKNGAAYVFGPQKGASRREVRILDRGLRHIGDLLEKAGMIPCEGLFGAGAAGGTGYGCAAFLGARIVSGIDAMLDICRFDELVRDASMIVTGEGRLDVQSLMGKAVGGIRRRSQGVPVTVFCGTNTVDGDKLKELGLEVIEIGRKIPLEESVAKGESLLRDRAVMYFKEKGLV